MCRVAKAEFEGGLDAAGAARRWLASQLRRWELQELEPTAVLLTSELVANAWLHAASGPVISAAVAEGALEVGVADGEPHLPRPTLVEGIGQTLPGADALLGEGGRGLLLVDALADEWGAAQLARGKQVWFRLDTAHWPYRTACRCDAEDSGRVRLESGRYAIAIPGPWDRRTQPGRA
jgi:anti-sigma regulatory factor (Ser/Thr protein kinase)